MEEASQRDRITSSPAASDLSRGGRTVEPNLTEQPLSPKDERIFSTNPSPDAAITGPSRDVTYKLESSYTSGTLTSVYPQEQTYFYGGYENSNGNWDDYSRFVSPNGPEVVPPAMYNDNSSPLFQSRYGLYTQMAYGQFPPMASPLSPIMVDGQLYSPHQIPVSPPYFSQSVSPGVTHATSSLPISKSELVTAGNNGQEGLHDNVLFGPGSGYFVHFGSFGGGGLCGEPFSNMSNSEAGCYLSPLASPGVYPQPLGILGPYEHNIGQISQQRPSHGFGMIDSSSARNYPHGSSYQSTNYSTASTSHWGTNYRSQLIPDKGGRRERGRDSAFVSIDSHGISSDRNRGPRASKPKGKSSNEDSSMSVTSKNVASISGVHLGLYNQPDFLTDYENAKFFIIKSFSEDNVHKSIKYSVWASTPLGNRKLQSAYHEAKEMKGQCPIFLLFSVNASGQFCGAAEMVGPVDFENDADYWQQDRWSGQFPVWWHIIKDVPNSQFRHILLENNDNKPVTHSRDSQEVKLEHGIEMLKIFKDHEADASIMDDFSYYDEREKGLQERKARQQPISTKNASDADSSINLLSENFAESLQLEDDGKQVPKN
ncbi:YTH domain-containing protein ECT2-like isoform X2 [Actinidia eriantha]|uniref:YTH domain-containing protein ECT2-like isoform X2 n=1 Tax=Actinidia eriantha TaxID=165200 RepID=UPI002589103F|nr:YTH domain-containing protein ECT2-like isoform X2 [Actinidia eriantha]